MYAIRMAAFSFSSKIYTQKKEQWFSTNKKTLIKYIKEDNKYHGIELVEVKAAVVVTIAGLAVATRG